MSQKIQLFQNKNIAKQGGGVAKKARVEIEKQTGRLIITNNNNKLLKIKNEN